MIELKMLNTIMALICTCGIYTIVSMIRSNMETDKINRISASVLDDLVWFKDKMGKVDEGTHIEELSPEFSKHFIHLSEVYGELVKSDSGLKDSMLKVLAHDTGRSYTAFDLHICFENKTVNRLFIDLVFRGSIMFSNIVGLALLKKHGFDSRYKQIIEESGL
jgi:hypothetical protein